MIYKCPTTPLPRLAPERPLPPYAYLPGRTPHPTRDPEGHSYAAEAARAEAPGPDAWRDCGDYLYGIDLFNHGFFWEAHEAWEGLWVACGRKGATASYLQGLINLAAAGFKARWGHARGMRANAETALRLLKAAESQLGGEARCYMGLDVGALADYAERLSKPERSAAAADDADTPGFDLVLRPDW